MVKLNDAQVSVLCKFGLTDYEISNICGFQFKEFQKEKINNSITNEKRRLQLLKYYPHEKRKINYAFLKRKKERPLEANIKQRLLCGLVDHFKQNGIHVKSMCKGTLEQILGYTVNDLIKHLKIKDVGCLNGMDIDHIYPKSKLSFNSIHDGNFKRCWSLENLQLLPRKENRQKWNIAVKTGEK